MPDANLNESARDDPIKHPSQREFVAMMAMLFATIALSIDAMLPALPAIAAELSPADAEPGATGDFQLLCSGWASAR